MDCSFEGCERPVLIKSRQLCKAHYQQFYKGKPLTPIGSTRGGYNRKYEGVTCLHEGCEEEAKSRNYCFSHYMQWRATGTTYEKGEVKEMKVSMSSGFSTERWCPKCYTHVHWTKYHLEQEQCAECWRKHMAREVDVAPGVNAKKRVKTDNGFAALVQTIQEVTGGQNDFED